MTDHDPCCPTRNVGHAANTACWCAEIAKVRRDERERAAGRVQALADSVDAIGGYSWDEAVAGSLAAIRGAS